MEIRSGSRITRLEAKSFIGLNFMANVSDFYSDEIGSKHFGKDFQKVKIKVRITDVTLFECVDDTRFQLKILSLNDVVKGITLKEVLTFLGSKTPREFRRLHEELVGPIPQPVQINSTPINVPLSTPRTTEEEVQHQHILEFFKNHESELPNWGKFASTLATQQLNSAAVERVFSLLQNAFNDTQEKSLSDYVSAVVMKQYNNRGV
jgi:hypothetical protein